MLFLPQVGGGGADWEDYQPKMTLIVTAVLFFRA